MRSDRMADTASMEFCAFLSRSPNHGFTPTWSFEVEYGTRLASGRGVRSVRAGSEYHPPMPGNPEDAALTVTRLLSMHRGSANDTVAGRIFCRLGLVNTKQGV